MPALRLRAAPDCSCPTHVPPTHGKRKMRSTCFSQALRFACVGLLLGVSVAPARRWPARRHRHAVRTSSPTYEGFWRNADGSFDLLFGYYNRNWVEEIDVPVGAGNTVEPGGPDRGQPTHFFPRRNQFVFKVRVPPDFGNKEVVWTLTSNGVTEKAFGTLKPAYAVDETVMMANFGARRSRQGSIPA